jgi:uncharacterized iron-regulated membrane protein
VFLLLLCLTGLPLIFHHEIDELLGPKSSPPPRSPPIPAASCNISPGTRTSLGS